MRPQRARGTNAGCRIGGGQVDAVGQPLARIVQTIDPAQAGGPPNQIFELPLVRS